MAGSEVAAAELTQPGMGRSELPQPGLAARLGTRSAGPRAAASPPLDTAATSTAGGASATYRRRSYPKTKVPTARELHLLDRMGCGFSVASYRQLRKAGGATAWFEQQLRPERIAESREALAVDRWFPTVRHDAQTVWRHDQEGVHAAWEYARDLANYSLLKRILSTRTVFENMVELWSNHFHVDAHAYPGFTQRSAYDRTIRTHALGTFEELLRAVTLHPAMLTYLDNWTSVRGAPNENHGRELLELHTVGSGAGYTERMVKDSAVILSGHTVRRDDWTAYFDPKRHTTGPVSVLGFTHPNGDADSAGVAEAYLRHLARHPATARRVAHRLAVRFVADEPSEPLVTRLATAYLRSGTDLKETLRALVRSPEFWASAGGKVRTPADDVVATCRALQVVPRPPASSDSFAHALCWTLQSTLPFQWPRPDGPPDRAGTWASTTRLLNSWQMHANLAGGWWPSEGVTYQKPSAFLPRRQIRFDELVDHLSRVVLGRRSTSRLLEAASVGCDVRPGEVITKKHPVMTWKFVRLLAVLLDSPAHLTR